MSLDTLVQLSISKTPKVPSQRGFGTPLFMVYHNLFLDRVREYGTLDEVVAAGHTTVSPAYKMAQKAFSQNPKPQKIKIGRTTVHAQTVRITPKNTTVGFVYAYTVTRPTGVLVNVSYTVQASDTVALICDGLVTAFGAVTGLTPTDGTTHLDLAAATPGQLFFYDTIPAFADALFLDRTPDQGLAADLAAIIVEDPDFYGIALDSRSELQVNALAAAVEASRYLLAYSSSDSIIVDAGTTTDIMSDLEAASYARTFGFYSKTSSHDYRECAMLGLGLPQVPGSMTYAFKTLAGITVDSLTTGEESAVWAKQGNTYSVQGGASITYPGILAAGEFIDVTPTIDLIYARIQEQVLFVQLANPKVTFTDTGIALIGGAIQGVLDSNISKPGRLRGLTDTPAPKVTLPKAVDVSVTNRAQRILPDVSFTAYLSGAIHVTQISGSVSA